MFKDIYHLAEDEKYDIIYSDPPWNQTKGGARAVRPNQGNSLDYETMSLTDIATLHKHLKENVGSNPHTVFLWTIEKFLPQAGEMMKKLGYKLHVRMIWDKENGMAPAFTIRYAHEYLLWFYQPKMVQINPEFRGKYTSVLREKSTKHSKKPECAYKFIEDLFPNAKKIEIFARVEREGWASWGNEIKGFDEGSKND